MALQVQLNRVQQQTQSQQQQQLINADGDHKRRQNHLTHRHDHTSPHTVPPRRTRPKHDLTNVDMHMNNAKHKNDENNDKDDICTVYTQQPIVNDEVVLTLEQALAVEPPPSARSTVAIIGGDNSSRQPTELRADKVDEAILQQVRLILEHKPGLVEENFACMCVCVIVPIVAHSAFMFVRTGVRPVTHESAGA
jgi:hypothetical protein